MLVGTYNNLSSLLFSLSTNVSLDKFQFYKDKHP